LKVRTVLGGCVGCVGETAVRGYDAVHGGDVDDTPAAIARTKISVCHHQRQLLHLS
jgi:hypothetical protein